MLEVPPAGAGHTPRHLLLTFSPPHPSAAQPPPVLSSFAPGSASLEFSACPGVLRGREKGRHSVPFSECGPQPRSVHPQPFSRRQTPATSPQCLASFPKPRLHSSRGSHEFMFFNTN